MKLFAIIAALAVLCSFAIASEDMKSAEIGVAIEMLVKDTGETTLESIDLVEGYPDHKLQPEEGFTAKVYGFDGTELYSFKFPVEFWFYDNPTVLTETYPLIIFPHYRNIREAKIYDKKDNLQLTIDLSDYATCNQNGVCNPDIGEDNEYCPSDCKAGEAEELEAEQAAQVPEDMRVVGPGEKPFVSTTTWLIILLAVVLVAIIIGLVKSGKKQ
ncbi:MAG: hypothetical protein PHO02_06755 [Candidatus Nanoarchaeia archaeon]|nr:hypothetical protein [Candidatus Nanoarchaeia archaeon]